MFKKYYDNVFLRMVMVIFLCVLLVSTNQLQGFSADTVPAGEEGGADPVGKTISGTVLAEDTNQPVTDPVNINTYIELLNHQRTGVNSQAVGANGQFSVTETIYQDFILQFNPDMVSDYLPKDLHVTISDDMITIDDEEYNPDNFSVTLCKTKVRGTVTKADGTSLNEMSVQVYEENESNNHFITRGSNSSGSGLYKLWTEGYGELSFFVYDRSSEQYGFSDRVNVTINEDGSYFVNNDNVSHPFGDVHTLDLQLPGLQFKGKVYDSDGTTIQNNAYVVIRDTSENVIKKYQVLNRQPLNGVFLIGGLPDGTYFLTAESKNQVLSSVPKEIKIDGSGITVDNIPYNSADYVALSLSECNDPSLVSGFLTDDATGNPIEGVSFFVSVPNGGTGIVSTMGKLMIAGLADGEHTFWVYPDIGSDYLSQNVSMVITGDTVTINNQNFARDSVSIGLKKTRVKGTVRKPDGTLDQDMFIKVYRESGSGSCGSNSGNGMYKLKSEGSGKLSYYVYDESSELYGFSGRVDMIVNEDGSYVIDNNTYPSGAVQTIDFSLPVLQFKGRVLDAGGTELLTNAYVLVKNEQNEIVRKYKMIDRDEHRGVFLIGGLPDGIYSLTAEIEEGASKRSSIPKAIKIQNAGITVDDAAYNSQNYIDLLLTERTISEGARVINFEIVGKDTLQPLAGPVLFHVYLEQPSGNKFISSGILPSNGKLELVGLINEKYRVYIEPDGTMNYSQKSLVVKVSQDTVTINNQPYSTENITIYVYKTIAMGTVYQPDGTIAEDALPNVYPSNDSPSDFSTYGSNSGDGTYRLNAEGHGKLTYYLFNRFSESFGFSDTVDVMINEDGSFSLNDQSYAFGDTQTVNLNMPELQFKGKVYDSNGTDIQSNAYVIIKNATGEIVKKYRLYSQNPAGVFLIGGLPDGTYSIAAQSTNRIMQSASKEVKIEGSNITVDNVPYNTGSYICLSLSEYDPSLVSGCLVDKDTNQPIHEDGFHFSVPQGCTSDVSTQGQFWINGLTDGEHNISVWMNSSSDYLIQEFAFVVSGDTVTINGLEYPRNNAVIPVRKTKVKGTVTKPDGTVTSNMFIHVYSPDNSILCGSNSGNGNYKIVSEGSGKLSYYVYDQSSELYGFSGRVDMTVNEDGSYSINNTVYPKGNILTVNLELPSLQLKGKVLNATGTALQTNSYVTVKNASDEIVRSYKMIDRDQHQGVFLIGGLPDGTYSLMAEMEESTPKRSSIPKQIKILGTNITVDGIAYSSVNYIDLRLVEPAASDDNNDDSPGGGNTPPVSTPTITPAPTVIPKPTTAPVPTPVPLQNLKPEEQKQIIQEISNQLAEGTKDLVGSNAEETKSNLHNVAGSISGAIANLGQSALPETQDTLKKAVDNAIGSLVIAAKTFTNDDDLQSAGASLNQIISNTAAAISGDLDSTGSQAVTESIGNVISGAGTVINQVNDLNKAAELAKSVISSAASVLAKVDGGASETIVADQLKTIAQSVVDKAGKQTVAAVKTGDTAVASVQGEQLKNAIKQLETAKAVARELQDSLKGNGINDKIETTVAIDIQVGTEEKNVKAELPKELMEAVGKNGIDKVEITAGETKIDLPQGFVDNAGTQSLALEVRKEEATDELKSKMTEEQKKLLENNPTVFNFNAIVGDAQVTEFNKPVGIRIKYQPKENENHDNITILYLADDGTIQNMTGKYDEATGEVIFSTNHFSKYIIKNLVLSFTDVSNDFWGIGYIGSMASKGIIEGIGNGQFLPHDNVTRAEFAKMLTVAAGLVDKNAACEFTDVSTDKWYYRYISSAYAAGLTNGIYYTEFGPDVKMTRQEMVAMIANAMQSNIITSEEALVIVGDYNDCELLAGYAVHGMAFAVKAGIINGKPGKFLDPEGNATRAEAAAMVYRYFNY